MNNYFLKVQTDKNLGDLEFVEGFLTAWLSFRDGKLRPEYFALGEPIRKSFKDQGLEAAIKLWLDNKLPLLLRRGSSPRFSVDIKWREDKGLDRRPFPWGCSVWLSLKAGDASAIKLFRFLIEWFDPAFGMITTWEDLEAKHQEIKETRLGVEHKFVGLDVGETLPGINWQTYFHDQLLPKNLESSLKRLTTCTMEHFHGGWLLESFEKSDLIGTEQGRKAEQEIIAAIGESRFFK